MQTPAQIRDQHWEYIKDRLSGMRQLVYGALLRGGPQTTLKLAEYAGMNPFTVRPRISELCSLGLVALDGQDGRQGIYRAIPLDEAEHTIKADLYGAAQQMQLL